LSTPPGSVIKKMMQDRKQSYDTIAIGCFFAPVMQEARELLKMPRGRGVDDKREHRSLTDITKEILV
jgi:hypothetical protein